ncbi:MAG: NosD domain-containing protein [Candidatus Bathyarchaeia archaeon]
MSSRKREKSWKDRLRERQIRYQRFLEFHRKKLERVIHERTRRAYRKKLFLIFSCFVALFIIAYGITHYVPLTPHIQENNERNQNDTQIQLNPINIEAILILADGSIYPSTAPIKRISDNYYIIDADITVPLKIGKDNIIIDGANHTLKGYGIYGSRGIDISNRKNVTIKNVKIEAFDYGVYMNSTSGCTVIGSEFINNYCAIWLTQSSNIRIESNAIANVSLSQGYGIWIKNSTGNLIIKNNITRYLYGIYLGGSEGNIIDQNLVKGNGVGMYIYFSFKNTISHNSFIDNRDGIHLLKSQNNTILLNVLSGNNVGLGLDSSSGNVIYHNSFINNSNQLYSNNSTNIWDGGRSLGGNYWSDYTGKDEDGDGIGDTPYTIDETNKDSYPLMTRKV